MPATPLAAVRHGRLPSVAVRGTLRTILTLLVGTLIIPPGCGSDGEPDAIAPVPFVKTYERGPVTLTLTVDRSATLVGEPIRLTLDVLSEPDVEVRMPALDKTHGPFAIDDANLPPDVPDGVNRRWIHEYVFSSYEHGELEAPPITIDFIDQRDPDRPQKGSIVTDPIPVNVTTVLAAGVDTEMMRDIKEAVLVPINRARPWLLTGVALLVVALLLTWWFYFQRRRAGADDAQPTIPAHVWALLELERLEQDRLVERGEIHTFYTRLSGVVRQYIERRFEIMAPEQTTDEFLREARRRHELTIGHKELLAGFLRAADMVKFALHMPGAADCEDAFRSAGVFVEDTTPQAVIPDEEGEGLPEAAA